MNEAKRRREALRQAMLETGAEWDFPPSSWEAETCAELKDSPVVMVRRASAAQLAWARMPSNKCHDNARWYAKNDLTGKTEVVTGWYVQWPDYILHSVVKSAGRLLCITPGEPGVEKFPFVPDSKILWKENGEVYSFTRNGQEIGPGVRTFPAFTMARTKIIRERLLAGEKPYRALEFTDEEMLELKRRYADESAELT